jgi:hypothetical protein
MYLKNPQLEIVESATDYIPYQHSLSYLPISSPLYKGDQIVKIGSEYKVRRENGVVVFDGSEDESWGVYVENDQNIIFQSKTIAYGTTNLNQISNMFMFGSSVSLPFENKFGIGGKSIYVGVNKTLCANVDDFKSFLGENQLTVVYQLDSPVYEDIDQDQFYSIMSADELTNVSLLGENENLVPTNVIRFPRNEDGALSTTAYAVAKKYEDAYQGMAPSGIEDRIAALETQMAALNAQTIIVE